MTTVGFFFPQLFVQFANEDVLMVIADPFQSLFGMGIRARSMRFTEFVLQRAFCPVVSSVSARQGFF